jgi:hypothetical protein
LTADVVVYAAHSVEANPACPPAPAAIRHLFGAIRHLFHAIRHLFHTIRHVRVAVRGRTGVGSGEFPLVRTRPACHGCGVDANYRYQPNMRFAESDREAVAARLRDAHADGRLTYQEFSERLDDLYRATTYADLAPIVADLRQPGPARRFTPADASRSPALRARRHGLLPILVACVAIWFVVVVVHGILLPLIFWILVVFVVMRILRHRRRSSYR